MDSVEIKHFTVAQVRDWLMHNIVAEGLTNEVIRPDFAWALIHNPYVQDDDPIVACIYDDGSLAASTCAFPEVLIKPDYRDAKGNQRRVWWFPMLWVKPEYRGKGYGLVAIGSLAEIYGTECSWTAWAVPESIEIFDFLGCKTYYFSRYIYSDKEINTLSFKGKLATFKKKMQIIWNQRKKPKLPDYDYQLRYFAHVDDESYRFICNHRGEHFFHNSQSQINWELQYPWGISIPLMERVPTDSDFFNGKSSIIQNTFIQVWINDTLEGVYILKRSDKSISIDSLYYNKACAEIIYVSIVEHILSLGVRHFETEDVQLAYYVNRYVYFQKCNTENLSLSISPLINVPKHIVR